MSVNIFQVFTYMVTAFKEAQKPLSCWRQDAMHFLHRFLHSGCDNAQMREVMQFCCWCTHRVCRCFPAHCAGKIGSWCSPARRRWVCSPSGRICWTGGEEESSTSPVIWVHLDRPLHKKKKKTHTHTHTTYSMQHATPHAAESPSLDYTRCWQVRVHRDVERVPAAMASWRTI